MSLGRLTININAHEFSTARHGSPLDQTTEGIHRLTAGHYFDESIKSEDS
ncbi:hypothetical protein J3Q64DRAFT_1839473 [Phycomyces blakesleeanus]|uniref:Uncharacterized protein n=1 Tax=Phycomyces blakesleeanus TaxID=4837 RepID=A0ABR3AN42_PHYBL